MSNVLFPINLERDIEYCNGFNATKFWGILTCKKVPNNWLKQHGCIMRRRVHMRKRK